LLLPRQIAILSTPSIFDTRRTPTTWKASGHVDNFNDPMIDNKDSKKRYRVDHLIEGHAEQMEKDGRLNEAKGMLEDMERLLAKDDFEGLKKLIMDHGIKCPVSGTTNWTDIRQFNLMFATEFGAVSAEEGEDNKVYLRPETAQGIFVNFLNVQKTGRMKIPFGIAQTGKALDDFCEGHSGPARPWYGIDGGGYRRQLPRLCLAARVPGKGGG